VKRRRFEILQRLQGTDEFKKILKLFAETEGRELKHAKLRKLSELLEVFFNSESSKADSKVIVYTNYRDSAHEIKEHLDDEQPDLIRSALFMGQGNNGVKQSEQKQRAADFRSGVLNTLISTSVGEEGLDIGEVDLIVSYDVMSSPIRMVQRIGRTGRQKQGYVIMLVSEGKEMKRKEEYEKKATAIMANLKAASARRKDAQVQGDLRNSHFMKIGGRYTALSFFDSNPRMLPDAITPQVQYRKLRPREEAKLSFSKSKSPRATRAKREPS
jgi:ERCC4-related helicase